MRKAVLVGGAVAVLVAAVVAWRVVAPDGDGGGGSAASGDPGAPPGYPAPRPLDDERRALLDSVVHRPSCPTSEPMPRPADDEVLVDHFRVEDGCLVLHSELVDADDAFARIEALRAEPGVVSADLRPNVVRADQDDQDDDWDLREVDREGLRDLADLDPEALWPYGELRLDEMRALDVATAWRPPIRVGLIDEAVDRRHPELVGAVPLFRRSHADGFGGGHGTNMASLIAALDEATARGGPLRRLTPEVEIVASDLLDTDPSDLPKALGEEIEWLVNQGVDVISMSLVVRCDGIEFKGRKWEWDCGHENAQTAIDSARKAGVVVVASGGNSGEAGSPEQAPAGYDGVIAVSNHDRGGRHFPTSTANEDIDISAPGTDVLMAGFMTPDDEDEGDPNRCRDGYEANGALWCTATGASPAAAFVSAAVAWLKARHPQASPEAIESALFRGARLPDGQEPGERSDDFGYGYLDPLAADEILGEGMDNGSLVAFLADDATTLAVVDTATGLRALLQHTDGSMGSPTVPLRWSPSGGLLAGRTSAGTVTVWDAEALDFADADDPGYGPEAQRFATLTYPGSGGPGCILDFAFVDDRTVVALEAPGTMSGSSCGPTGTQLRTYDLSVGGADDPVTTPPLTDLVGVLDDGSILATGRAAPAGAPLTFTWLDPAGEVQKTVEVPDSADTGDALGPLLAPDGRAAAQVVRRPTDGTAGIAILDIAAERAAITPLPETSDGVHIEGLRWAPSGTLVASLQIVGTAAPSTAGDHRLWALREGEWHPVDGDPLVAGQAVGYRTQVVVSADYELMDDGWAYGDLYVLHNRPYGEPAGAYAAPGEGDVPVATGVDLVWPSPAGPPERPFLVE